LSRHTVWVIYDGGCGICQALKDRAQRLDRHGCLQFTAYQTADLARIAPDISPELARQALYTVRSNGRQDRGARAVFQAMRCLPGIWGMMGTIGVFPPVSLVCEPLYRLVARYRHTLSRWLRLNRCAIDETPSNLP